MMQPFQKQKQHHNQGCPNLNAQGILARAYETFHFEILLKRFKKLLDLPAVLVDGGNGGGTKRQLSEGFLFNRS